MNTRNRLLTRTVAATLTVATFVAACTADEESNVDDPVEVVDETFDGSDDAETPAPPDSDVEAGAVDLTLERDDVDCSDEGLGADELTEFTVAHYVVDGSLGAVCHGVEDDALYDAWTVLSTITPPGQLADLGLFAGIVSGDEDEITLAFVNRLDDDGTLFQMSINLERYAADENEAQLTMAHEFSHVFTALPSQIDRSDEAFESCDTYFNGEGCFEPDSLMWLWIEEFWGDGLIDEIDPMVEASGAAGEERCSLHPGFLGSYAASNPEEDFAESFSAMVFQLEPDSDEQAAKFDWLAAQPGLVEFRDRAIAAGIGPLANNFELCGQAA